MQNALLEKWVTPLTKEGWYICARDTYEWREKEKGCSILSFFVWQTDWSFINMRPGEQPIYGPFPSRRSMRNGLPLLAQGLVWACAENPLVEEVGGEYILLLDWKKAWEAGAFQTHMDEFPGPLFDVPDPLAEPHPAPASPSED